ncbi:MAG: SGNH/GDSL hydrolase family protein [Geminicoccaceae bacterium]
MPDREPFTDQKPIRVTFFGDSTCVGQGVSIYKGWVPQIAKALDEAAIGMGREILVTNASVNGRTTRQALEDMPYHVQGHGADIIVVQFGLNDCNHWATDRGLPRVSLPAFVANLREIIARAERFGAFRVLLNNNHSTSRDVEIMPHTEMTYEASNRRYNQAIRVLANDVSDRVRFQDIEASFRISSRQADISTTIFWRTGCISASPATKLISRSCTRSSLPRSRRLRRHRTPESRQHQKFGDDEMSISSDRFQFLADVPSPAATARDGDHAMHVLFLADDNHPANVVMDHINEIAALSDSVITLINPRRIGDPEWLSTFSFDAVLIHYSIFILSEVYLPPAWKAYIKGFSGVRAIIHEDEYQQINHFRTVVAELGICAVFSCLDSPETMAKVYDIEALSAVNFYSCLPGYIARNFAGFDSPPIAERPLDIVYRGRNLPAQLGRLAQEKRTIGEQVEALAHSFGLKTDIASSEADRIFGEAWPAFLMSGRAMLGVEGGASMFDFDGALASAVAAYQTSRPDADFEEVWQACLKDHEGNVDFRTITPKFFEAIATRTALILYPGAYNGILRAHEHYIPLDRDGSNFPDVAAKLADTKALQAMVDRTYDDIMGRQNLRMGFYVKKLDAVLDALRQKQPQLKEMPLIKTMRQQNAVTIQLLAELATQQQNDAHKLRTIEDSVSLCKQHLSHINQRLDNLHLQIRQQHECLQRRSIRSLLRRYTIGAPESLRRMLQKAKA